MRGKWLLQTYTIGVIIRASYQQVSFPLFLELLFLEQSIYLLNHYGDNFFQSFLFCYKIFQMFS